MTTELQRLAGTVPELRGAVPERRLARGIASEQWLLRGPRGAFVARLDRPAATAALGLDRRAELQVLEALRGSGLAPEPVYAAPAEGVLVTPLLPGHAWTGDDLARSGRLDTLAGLLRRLHRLPPAGKAFDPAAIARHYARGIATRAAERQARQVAALAADLYSPDAPRRICHHDAHAGNVLGLRQARLLDWEYAAAGDPLLDIAVVSRFHRLAPARRSRLLQAWSGSPDPALGERLQLFELLYDGLTALWEGVVATLSPAGTDDVASP